MKNWIILDLGSTVNLFSNPDLVEEINKVDKEMHLASNAGVKTNNQKAEVPQYGEVWYYEEAITNIFSLKYTI